ncbi:MAG: ATP-binding protein [Blastocatellia bacterium]
MRTILVIDDDQGLRQTVEEAVGEIGFQVCHASSAEAVASLLARVHCDLVVINLETTVIDGVAMIGQLRRADPRLSLLSVASRVNSAFVLTSLSNLACDLILIPSSVEELRSAIVTAVDDCRIPEMRVLSARPHWVQLDVPCDLNVVPILQKYLTLLHSDVPEETREGIAYAFREMLNNAIEHGGKLDPSNFVEVLFIRMTHAIIVWIKDPGEGFDIDHLSHAAVGNPEHDPFRHVIVRDEKGLRAGGFGILLTHQLVDELVYNERRNELMFVKYL